MTRDAEPHIRAARPGDAEHLARLINLAREGIPQWSWGRAAATPDRWLDVGVQRARRDQGGFSWKNAWVVETGGQVVAMLLGHVQPDPCPVEEAGGLPDVLRPMAELEAMAPGSWYVRALAAYPDYRSKGLGSRLLAVAEGMARMGGSQTLSVIVAEPNHGACALYARHDYTPVARRAIVPCPGCESGGDWLLMVKTLPARHAPVRPGRYRHYKGGEYQVIDIARHSESGEDLVVYRPLYGESGLWARPVPMFDELVEHDGRLVRRFTQIDEPPAATALDDWRTRSAS